MFVFDFEDGTPCITEIGLGAEEGTIDKTVTGLSECDGIGVAENVESFSLEMFDALVVVSIFDNSLLESDVIVDTCGNIMTSGLDKSDETFFGEFEIEWKL